MPTCLSRGGTTSMALALNLPDPAKALGSDDERRIVSCGSSSVLRPAEVATVDLVWFLASCAERLRRRRAFLRAAVQRSLAAC
jgi:hypothetical protein